VIVEERLDVWADPAAKGPLHAIQRDRVGCKVFDASSATRALIPVEIPPTALALTAFGNVAQPAIRRVVKVLEAGQVHVPFDVTPNWLVQERQGRSPLRDSATLGLVSRLGRFGRDFTNCWFALSQRPRSSWNSVIEKARAGLGAELLDIKTPVVGRGQVELNLHFGHGILPASALSDGQLAWLAFVLLSELGEGFSFLAFDEPETCLHPELLVRVVWLLQDLAGRVPVIVSTHSDRFLDALEHPEESAVLCRLDRDRATRLLRPDGAALALWLERYRGLGDLRGAGYERHVMTVPAGEEE
jgi:predicted ATPase